MVSTKNNVSQERYDTIEGTQACKGAAPSFNIKEETNRVVVRLLLYKDKPIIENIRIMDPNVWLKKYFKAASPELRLELRIKGTKVNVFSSKANQHV